MSYKDGMGLQGDESNGEEDCHPQVPRTLQLGGRPEGPEHRQCVPALSTGCRLVLGSPWGAGGWLPCQQVTS